MLKAPAHAGSLDTEATGQRQAPGETHSKARRRDTGAGARAETPDEDVDGTTALTLLGRRLCSRRSGLSGCSSLDCGSGTAQSDGRGRGQLGPPV